jgi:quercetin dioxygenase-like cupin family protein
MEETMRHYRIDDIPDEPDHSPIFVGSVTRKSMVTDENPGLLRANVVTFHYGARNKLHHHATDQLLVVTSGEGIVATESEQFEVVPGDVIHIPAGERHWHGAREGATFAHISILTPGGITIDEED